MPLKIKAGSKIICKKKSGVVGAIIFRNGKVNAITACHILKVGNCALGDNLRINGINANFKEIYTDLDLACLELDVSKADVDISQLDTPYIGPCYALNGDKKIEGNIMTVGKTYHYLSFSYRNLPLPGDSGSPIIQEGKVVGILLSIFLNNATGIAASLQRFIKTS